MTDPANSWRQFTVRCSDWRAAEDAAVAHLAPLLTTGHDDNETTAWWFVRKGPSWRLRLAAADRPGDDTGPGRIEVLSHRLDQLIHQDVVQRWVEQIYEPETAAFGGPAAMDVAHRLFSADSRHLLAHLARTNASATYDPSGHRRELGMLLGTRLLSAAGLDWYEQGDVWLRLASHRAPTGDTSHPTPEPRPFTVAAVGHLLTAADDSPTSPLHTNLAWPAAFDQAGRGTAELAGAGRLDRGLRAVLTHHLLFAFNRLGVSADDQYVLATAAAHYVLQENHVPHHPDAAPAVEPSTDDVERLREELVDYIRGRGTFRTPQVEQAFRTVPRHVFLPGVDLADAYAPRPVVTRRAGNGTALSSASSPNLVADMLELLAAEPGDHVLEIGAATGINAALLAELVGPAGRVVTVEIDDDLACGARTSLTTAGYHRVEVVHGDGALGHPATAPYNRIIVTAGAWDIPTTWWDQLAASGRLVVPVRLHGSGLTRVLPFDRIAPDRMVATSALVCGFVPMRGAHAHPENAVRLAEEVVIAVDTADDPDIDALSDALRHPARSHWTGVHVRHDEPAEHLDLWLATTASAADRDLRFGRLSVSRTARNAGLVDPALRWAGAALHTGDTLAYLTARRHTDDANELGITAHGPESTTLTDQLGELLRQWAQQRPSQPTITATPGSARPGTQNIVSITDHITDHVAMVRDHTRLTLTW